MKPQSIAGYGNLINRVMDATKQPTPEVGMGATETYYSDRQAGTIVRIVSPKAVEWVEDKATRTDKNGISESQDYTYEFGTGPATTFTLRKNGRWVRKGQGLRSGNGLIIGIRDQYEDPSF